MFALGFDSKKGYSVVLREEKEIKDRTENVLIRNPNNPMEVEEVKVYTGKLRNNYSPPKEIEPFLENIHFIGDVMHIFNGKTTGNISDYGNDY